MTREREIPELSPMDAFNRALVENAHPKDWENPEPAKKYNLVVIGAGTAGLVCAAGAAGLGAKVALVEENLLGGDCLNAGCVPSKAVIRSARAAADVAEAAAFGIRVPGAAEADFGAVMERMRRLRAEISPHDSAQRFKGLGVDVFLGRARFTGRNAVEVEPANPGGGPQGAGAAQTLRFRKAVIATGARAARPEIPGLAEAGFLTNENVFNLTERPRRLACIGAGPIGCELAQAFRRLGSEVFLFHAGAHILNREDPDAAEILQRKLAAEGVKLILSARILRVERDGNTKIIRFERAGAAPSGSASGAKEETASVDEILVGTGRTPNVEGLGLEKAGVDFDAKKGVRVNDYLQTANPDVYAAGDVCMDWKFTHAADAAARIVLQNALFFRSKKLSRLTMPWCTYTDPEIAHVGMYERDAAKRGIETETFVRPMSEVDRAVTDGETEGFVKVHVRKGSGEILGATIVNRHAGEMIGELSLAIASGAGLGSLSGIIHSYPTQADAIRQLGDQFNRKKLTPAVRKIFSAWLKWKRG